MADWKGLGQIVIPVFWDNRTTTILLYAVLPSKSVTRLPFITFIAYEAIEQCYPAMWVLKVLRAQVGTT